MHRLWFDSQALSPCLSTAVLIREAQLNPCGHELCDRVAALDAHMLTAVTRMSLGALNAATVRDRVAAANLSAMTTFKYFNGPPSSTAGRHATAGDGGAPKKMHQGFPPTPRFSYV